MNTEKEKAIEIALTKLTEEDKKALGLIKKPKKLKVKKNYKLKIEYMIGDANGHTDEEAIISVDNPFLKILTDALDKLQVCEGSWGIQLEEDDYYGNFKNKNINELEYDLLCLLSNYQCNEELAEEFLDKHKFENTEKNHDYLYEFEGILVSDAEYSFLVYEGYKLK